MPANTKFNIMKTILALATAAITLGFAAPSESKAWDRCSPHSRIVSHLPCGRPVYANYVIYGRDRCGNPVGRWVTQRQACGCSLCSPRPVCPPPSYGHHGSHHHHGHSSRSGVSWFFSFGR
ncbi:MAG: hypothetical protein CJBNEKGG_03229 [Prosthecobacter sp.]|nr:hypothetical protein [Prosthecobacter sp.]